MIDSSGCGITVVGEAITAQLPSPVTVAESGPRHYVGSDVSAAARLSVIKWWESSAASGKRFRALAGVEEEDDGFVSFSPSLPGAASQGSTSEEALANLHEALAGCIEAYMEKGDDIPWVQDPTFTEESVIHKWIDVDV